ncbi:MAG: alpha/beta hydrolase [Proteobacteria bacterium]|nr:alpha/beta hydrolase [Pseudomonadota bacterium]
MSNQTKKTEEPKRVAFKLARRLLRIVSLIVFVILVVVLGAVVGLSVYEPAPATGFAFDSLGKTIRLADARTLAYLDSGDPEGRPVFYFHGGPGSRAEGLLFDELNRRLGIRMIVIDRPGYGLSDFQEDRTYLDWPDDVGELADRLGIDRFAVLGWSSGGPYAAAVAHKIPRRLAVAAIVSGESPYASADYPQSVLEGDTFAGSGINRLFIWSANHGAWLMRTLFSMQRVALFHDPAGLVENADSFMDMSEKDKQFFTREAYASEQLEALRQGVEGWTRDFTLERRVWPFALEEIHAPTVLVFHGEDDTMLHPKIAEYVCSRIPSCDQPTIYSGEGHSVVVYRYEEIMRAILAAWK